uniref:SAFB-like, transcription modulator n=1 Tax=Oryzias latipes TaxID=8090 RepID=A0A3P9HES0_ORYLA
MASGAISTGFKKISELRVVDLKSELKRRNLDTIGVKSILLARLKKAIEDEGGDPENIQIQLSTDSTTRKSGKFKGKKTDSDVETTTEEDSYVKENEECESEKDVTDTDDGTRENSKPPPCGESLACSEAEPETEAIAPEDDSEPEPEAEVEPGDEDAEAEAEAESEVPELDAEAMSSSKDAEDDHLFVSMQNEDAITLDVDGDDLLDTGKHVKLLDPEAEKSIDEPEASADTDPDDDMKDKELEGPEDGKDEDESGDKTTKKAETGDKDKDSGNKGPSTSGASGQEKSSSRDRDGKAAKDEKAAGSNSSSSQNLWVSGLSSNTKAADLKNLFGKYGKVLSAKVVTNARSPGSKCYGLVTMSSSTEVTRCITHLDCTELHGQEIYVKRAKNDPFKKGPSKNEEEDKASSNKLSDKRISAGTKMVNKAQSSNKKAEKKPEKSLEKDKDLSKKQEARSGRSESVSSNSDHDSLKKDDRKHGRSISPGKVMMVDHNRGDPNFRPRPFRRGRYFDQPFPNPNFQRQPRWLIPPEELEIIRQKRRQFSNKDEVAEILPFEKIKEQREQRIRERMERARRAVDLRRRREMAEQERRERERVRLLRESEEHENLLRERQRLEMERQKLERERLERERLERERIRIEQERRKEAERMAREREELRRQQEQLRFEEKRNNFKRGREPEHGRREGPFWNGNKKIQQESEVRSNQGSNFNRPQNRFPNFNPRERGRFPEAAAAQQPNTFDRRNRFDGEPEMKKSRPAPLREGAAFDRYPKNFDAIRRPVPPTRGDVRDTDRRDRDDRRPAPLHDRPVGPRAPLPTMSHTRTARVGGHGQWKNEGLTTKGDMRAPIRVHSERAGPSVNRGRSNFNDREEGRPVMISNQTFGSGRQVVVERHGREQGLRKDWHGSSSSQGGGFTDNRRIVDSRGSVMTSSHSSGIGRIVQITNNSNPSGGAVGGFKPFKGVPRPF